MRTIKAWFKRRFGKKRIPPEPTLDIERVENLLRAIRACLANPTSRNLKARDRHLEELTSIMGMYIKEKKEWKHKYEDEMP